MKNTLTEQETKLLLDIKRRQGTGDPATPIQPISPRLQTLIDRGYLRTTRLVIPVLGCYSDEVGLAVTEAGAIVLEWAGYLMNTPACPLCSGTQDTGHLQGCEQGNP